MDTSKIYINPRTGNKFKVADDCPPVMYLFTMDPSQGSIPLRESTTFEEAVEEARIDNWQVWLNNPFIKDSVKWAASRITSITREQMLKDTLEKGADYGFEYGFLDGVK